MKQRSLAALVVLALSAASTRATPIWYEPKSGPPILVEYVAGGGASETFLVVDFAQEAAPPDLFTFVYLWPEGETRTGEDALLAVDAAGALDVTLSMHLAQPGNWVDEMRYLDPEHAGVGSPFGSSSIPRWVYWHDSDSTLPVLLEWENAPDSPTVVVLEDGGYQGWNYVWTALSETRGPYPPRRPTFMPEPGSFVLLGLAAWGWRRRRRGRRESGLSSRAGARSNSPPPPWQT
jgi:hypothetical protein